MLKHTWVQKEDVASYLGNYRYWRCKHCGASGGVFDEPRAPFLAGAGAQYRLSDDCAASRDHLSTLYVREAESDVYHIFDSRGVVIGGFRSYSEAEKRLSEIQFWL